MLPPPAIPGGDLWGAKLKTHFKEEKDAVRTPTTWLLYKETL